MRELVFVDTESTGLNPKDDDLVELSYATLDSDIKTLYFGITEVPPFIDDLIGFTKRGIAGRTSTGREVHDFLNLSADNTMVAANPAHDKGFIEAFGLWKFHYRMLDIESFAFAKLDLPEVPGMKVIYDLLKARGYNLPEPDHSSAGDVDAMRDAYIILKDLDPSL